MKKLFFVVVIGLVLVVIGCGKKEVENVFVNGIVLMVVGVVYMGQDWSEIVVKMLEGGFCMGNFDVFVKFVEYVLIICLYCCDFIKVGVELLK